MKNKGFLIFFPLFMILIFSAPSYADIIVIKVTGVVNPVMAEFISKSLDKAVKEKANALVIELDTPGGLDTSMREIVKKIIGSEIPIVVYVSPGGARAASAGVFITLSAHIAAMAPGTNIGAAHPVGLGGKMDKTMLEKAENDAAAYIKSIAEKRGRNTKWAEGAVRKSVSITEGEAFKLKVIDLISPSLDSLLKSIHGREVETVIGRQKIKTEGVKVSIGEMGLRHRILKVISDPNIAYILMMLGFYGIFFELTNPGAIFPGVAGALFLILAFYSFQVLPVNYAGLLLILLAIILFILEVKITSYGALTIGGIVSMLIGSIMLFDSPLPFFKLSMAVVIPAVLITALFFTLTVGLAIKAYRRKPVTGVEELKGMEGVAKTDVYYDGMVFVHGEIWSVSSDEPIKAGEKVVIESIDGLKLKVKKKEVAK
ncbi:MAG: nodulation protein NfeD [Nitrospirae bacterium]|nr:nodulation protein NfeD [Nitrospirota bacterium]